MTRERVLLGLYAVAWVLVIAYVVFGLPGLGTKPPSPPAEPIWPTMEAKADASDSGFRAGLDGLSHKDCPYLIGNRAADTSLRLAWLEGWIEGTDRRQWRALQQKGEKQ